MKNILGLLISFIFIIIHSIDSRMIADYDCRIPTCRDFQYGLRNYHNYEKYTNVCSETVNKFRMIPFQKGLCFNSRQQINPQCIYAVADTIKSCMNRLEGVAESTARYLCGFTLMKYCARHVGLDRFPLHNPPASL